MAWICGACRARSPHPLYVCPSCGGTGAEVARDPAMEAHLCALSLWFRALGVFGFAAIAYMGYLFFSAGADLDEMFGRTDFFRIMGVYLFVGLVVVTIPFPIATFLVGHTLSRLSNAARILACAMTGLLAFGLLSDFVGASAAGIVKTAVLEVALVGSFVLLVLPRSSALLCRDYRDLYGPLRIDARLLRTPFLWGPAVVIAVLLLLG